MKKRLFITALMLWAYFAGLTAYGADTYNNVFDWYNQNYDKMPEWVSSVVNTDGKADRLTIIVNSESGREELLSLIEDESTLTLIVNKDSYSEAELKSIHGEIVEEYFQKNKGELVSVGIGWATIEGVVTGFGESGKETRVIVGVLEPYTEEYRTIFAEKYGDAVYVMPETQPAIDLEVAIPETEEPQDEAFPVPIMAGAAAVILCVAALIYFKKKKSA